LIALLCGKFKKTVKKESIEAKRKGRAIKRTAIVPNSGQPFYYSRN